MSLEGERVGVLVVNDLHGTSVYKYRMVTPVCGLREVIREVRPRCDNMYIRVIAM